MVKNNIERATAESLKWVSDNIQLSVRRTGKWYKEIKPMLVMNCLYARQGWRDDKAYVISIIKLSAMR